MRLNRWLPAAVAVAIVASGLGVALTRDSEVPSDAQSPSSQARPVTVGGGAGKVTAASKAAVREGRGDRDPADSELDPEDLGEPARVGRRRSDPNTFIVQFREGVSVEEMERAVRAVGADPTSTATSLRQVVAEIDPAEREEAEAELDQNPDVTAVADNAFRYASADPSDPGFYDQIHLLTSRLPVAWEVTKGSTALDIAILDTGIDLDHPDLSGRLVPGTDIVNGDNNPQDDEGHGTMVAGIAGAHTNNGIGVAGAAWNARIMPVKVLGSDGSGTDGDIALGIEWAVDHGAEVINLSLGGPGASLPLEQAVAYATSHNVIVVAASGNEGTSEPSMPAAIPDVVAVGATDLNGELAAFSNYGPWVDFVAPGTEIISTALGGDTEEGDYATGDGTSFASPIVAGVALMVRAKNTTWTPAQVAAKLRSSAADRGPDGIDDSYGFGLLDAYGAVGGRTAGSPPFANRGANEPNDVVDRATLVTTNAEGTISPEGDVDWYAFDAPAAGSIILTVNPGAPFAFDPVVEAFSPDLDALGSLDDAGAGGTEALSVSTAGPGRYTFRVSNFLGSREPATYTVTAAFTAGPAGGAGTNRLWVRSVTPEDFAAGVAVGVQPTVVFARDLDPSTVTTTTVRLLNGATGAVVPTTPTYDAGTKTVTLAPSAALTPGPYLIDVRGVADAGDVTMTKPYRSRFTVKSPTVNPPTRSDVNGDGYDDVVIGSPGEDIGSKKDAGVINVIFGSSTGSKTTGSQLWHQDTAGVPGNAESGDLFGQAIATGDVNNDGFDDVAVGAPGEDVGSIVNAGAVHLFLGSTKGLTASSSQIWEQNSSGVLDTSEAQDRFGDVLAFGRFDNIVGHDLAIGSPAEQIGTGRNSGAVHVLSGRSNGLSTGGAQFWTQANIYGADVPDARFGAALAAGDADGDSHDELAIGAPLEDIDRDAAGSVTMMQGTVVGLRPAGALWGALLNPSATSVHFGASFAFDDFGGLGNPDGYGDLAIGVPAASAGGRVDLLFGDWRGVGAIFRSAHQAGNGNEPESGDSFGSALASVRVKSSPTAWLGISAPGEDIGSVTDAGVVHVVGPSAWVVGGDTTVPPAISQNSAGVPDAAEKNDQFGSVLRLLDVDADGKPDAIVGTRFESSTSTIGIGMLHVLRRSQPGGTLTGRHFYQGFNGVSGPAEAGDWFGAAIGG